MMNILCIITFVMLYFSDALSVQDIKFVEDITDFVEQRNNVFKKDNFYQKYYLLSKVIKNIASETIINQDATDSLISCTEYGRKTCENFADEPFSKKSKRFLDVIPKKKEMETNTNQSPGYTTFYSIKIYRLYSFEDI